MPGQLDPSLQDLSGMTHWPEQPNPAAPYLEDVRKFAPGGLANIFGWQPSPLIQGLGEAASYSIPMGGTLGMMTSNLSNLQRIREIRTRLDELNRIETGLQRSGPGAYTAPRDPSWIDRRTLRGAMATDETERFKAMARQGMTHRQIADQMGLSKAAVTRKIQNMLDTGQLSYDDIRPQVGGTLSKPFDRHDELMGLVQQGLTQKQIRERMGIGSQTLGKALNELSERGAQMPERSGQGLGFGVSTTKGLAPTMPQFQFMNEPPNKDNFQDYIKALEKHLNDVKAYFNVSGTGYA
jgi:transposase